MRHARLASAHPSQVFPVPVGAVKTMRSADPIERRESKHDCLSVAGAECAPARVARAAILDHASTQTRR